MVYDYADDIAILVRGNLINAYDLMINTLKAVQIQCQTKCLTANPLKTDVVFFTRTYKPAPIEPLRLGGKATAFVISVTYLEIFLGPELNWKQHLTEIRKRFHCSLGV